VPAPAHRRGTGTAGGAGGPILVLGSGQRCGSTLVQRLLSSHPAAMIWGEHGGQLRELLDLTARMRDWADTHGRRGRDEYATRGYQSFMANLTPPAEQMDKAARRFITATFAEPARALGCHRWGFKEVRYGLAEATGIRALFPATRVVHLVRDPRDVLCSLEVWESSRGPWLRRDTEGAVRAWCRGAGSFLRGPGAAAPPVLGLRYEDVVADPGAAARAIAAHCDLEPDLLDLAVFARRIHRDGPDREARREIRAWSALPPSMRALLDAEEIHTVAAAYGYEL
jgi:hypothetical protein